MNFQLKKSSYTKEKKLSLTLKPLHLTKHNGNSAPFFQYHYLQFLEFIRDLIVKAIFKSEHEVAEVTAKLDSYTSNMNKYLSSE